MPSIEDCNTGVPEKTGEDPHRDGHAVDRMNMLPWDSCGTDCPVCAQFER